MKELNFSIQKINKYKDIEYAYLNRQAEIKEGSLTPLFKITKDEEDTQNIIRLVMGGWKPNSIKLHPRKHQFTLS